MKSNCEIKSDEFLYEVVVPMRTTSIVILPAAKMDNISFTDAKLKSKLLEKPKPTDIGAQLEFGSSTYRFSCPTIKLKS